MPLALPYSSGSEGWSCRQQAEVAAWEWTIAVLGADWLCWRSAGWSSNLLRNLRRKHLEMSLYDEPGATPAPAAAGGDLVVPDYGAESANNGPTAMGSTGSVDGALLGGGGGSWVVRAAR